jgi:hypothetical protein
VDIATLWKRLRNPAGRHDQDTSTLWTSPWAWRDEDGVYVGHNGEAWLYRKIPTNPIIWEDPSVRLQRGYPLDLLLREVGQLSTDPALGVAMLAEERELHIISVTWEELGSPATEITPELTAFQAACLDFLLPRKVLALGVKLKTGSSSTTQKKTWWQQLRGLGEKALGEDVPDRDQWSADYDRIDTIMRRHGAEHLDRTERSQIESWFNHGQGPDVLIKVTSDSIIVDDDDRIELAVVRGFNNQIMESPGSQWMLDAVTHPAGPSAISVRGQLQTANAARSRARSGLRRRRAQMEEERLTGDIERVEDTRSYAQSQQIEAFIALNQEPIITKCSIVMAARRNLDVTETYMDELRNLHGIDVAPLVMRQLDALDECLPCSGKRMNPFLQDITISMLAYCGLQGWSNLGDEKGVFMGLTDPDDTPCYLDLLGAPAANRPPAFAIFGDPGGGKTFLCQLIATQAALAGQQVIFINPKAGDSLATFAKQPAINGTVIKMTQLEKEGGYFDPFYYTAPGMAAEIATDFILAVLGGTGVQGAGFDGSQELKLSSGLRRGAAGGARCVAEALQYVDDPDVVRMVNEQMESSALFALGIGKTPKAPYHSTSGLTLIEFDRKLDFPERGKRSSDYSRAERVALAAVRLVTRASLEILMTSGGGVLIVDEAWTFLSHSAGLAALQQIGREGRSNNILPIFATQRVDDLIREGIDMESYISRVMVMELREERDATAALKLCGLDPTPERIRWLRQAGPQAGNSVRPFRPAMGLHRDLQDRHAAIYVGPVPLDVVEAFTTNPEEKRARDARIAQAEEQASGQQPPGPTFGAVAPPSLDDVFDG